jgi:hypothetical protein
MGLAVITLTLVRIRPPARPGTTTASPRNSLAEAMTKTLRPNGGMGKMEAEQQEQRGPIVKPARKPIKRKQLVSIQRGAAEMAEDRAKGSSQFESRAAVRRPSSDGVQRAPDTSEITSESRFNHDFSRVPTKTTVALTGPSVERTPTLGGGPIAARHPGSCRAARRPSSWIHPIR